MSSEWNPTMLKSIVEATTFMPDWLIYLGVDNEGGGWWTLHIVSSTPDSNNPRGTIRVNHSFLVPMADYNSRTWKAWIFECYLKVWRHETGEFLRFNGEKEFAPHHANGEDPYITWHVGDLDDTHVRAGESKTEYIERTSPPS